MVHTTKSLLLAGLATVTAAAAFGCSGAGGLGLAPPQNRLTDQTKYVLSAYTAPAPLPKELNKSLLPPYVVEPGDTLLVIPVDLDSPLRLPGDQLVEQDGTIDLGEFGRPLVAGKTVEVIEDEINRWIADRAEDKDGVEVSVRLVGRVSKVFYVLGEVNAPGAYPITGRETVLDGILTAGGISSQASTKRIILSRPTPPDGCRVALPVCYDNITQLGDTSTNYQLLPGDRIFVASAGILDILHDLRYGPCPPCNAMQVPCGIGAGGASCGQYGPAVIPVAPAVPVGTAPSQAAPAALPAEMPRVAPPDVYIAPPPVQPVSVQPVSVQPVSMVVPTIPVLPVSE